jgi:exonuclease VII large subunit
MEDKRTRLQQIAATARQAIRGKVLSTKTALRNLASRIPVALRARVAAVATAITSHWASAIALSRRECRNSATQVQSLCRRVPGSARGAVEKRRLRVQALHEKLAGADPAVILRRGFALIEDREGKVITSAKALSHPSELTIQFSDSKILATSHA